MGLTVFTHIPKTGGTTLVSVLRNQFSKQESYHFKGSKDEKPFDNLSPKEKSKFKLLYGHYSFRLLRFFDNADIDHCLTFLRNPVRRVISEYHQIVRSKDHYFHEEVTRKNMSLRQFVESDISTQVDNGQTRFISGMDLEPINTCTPEMLALAKKNLSQSFVTYGILEKYNQSVLLFKEKLGWDEYPAFVQHNVTNKKQEVDDHIISIIKERNIYDLELYNWALERFESQLKSIDNLENKLQTLDSVNIAYERGLKAGMILGKEEFIKKHVPLKMSRALYKMIRKNS